MTEMYTTVVQLAATEANDAPKEGIIEGLGIDWTLLVLQLVAFLLLVWILAKFVYPVFFRILDERQQKIDSSLKAAKQAESHAAEAEASIDAKLSEARKEARAIVGTAKDEAAAIAEKADKDAKARQEHMLAAAHTEIEREVLSAKKALHNETIELVAEAAERVSAQKLDAKKDANLIKQALGRAK